MLIRSQDKEMIINFDTICRISILGKPDPSEECIICIDGLTLGEYSDRKKAVKVLDMIQGAYTKYKTIHTSATGLATMSLFAEGTDEVHELYMKGQNALENVIVFQMPEDSEVEV